MWGRVANQDPCRTLASGLCKHKENVGRDILEELVPLCSWSCGCTLMRGVNRACGSQHGVFLNRDELWLTGSHVLQRRSEHVFSMKSCLMPCVSLSSAQLPKCLREKSFSVAVMSYIIMRLCFFFKALMCWPNNCKTEVYIGRLPPFTFFFFFF